MKRIKIETKYFDPSTLQEDFFPSDPMTDTTEDALGQMANVDTRPPTPWATEPKTRDGEIIALENPQEDYGKFPQITIEIPEESLGGEAEEAPHAPLMTRADVHLFGQNDEPLDLSDLGRQHAMYPIGEEGTPELLALTRQDGEFNTRGEDLQLPNLELPETPEGGYESHPFSSGITEYINSLGLVSTYDASFE